MLAETTHSVADTLNEVLLYVGVRRGPRPADERHPFGYGQARYTWSLLAAVGIFVVGGLFAIADGVQTLRRPEPVTNVPVGVAVLLVSAGLEGLSWRTARRQLRAEAAARQLDLGAYLASRRIPRRRRCSWRIRPRWSASRWLLLRWCSTSPRDRRSGTARQAC
jgi:Cation efflux family